MTETHRHERACWERYEPCGEHHQHDANCGTGRLSPKCPRYVRDVLGLSIEAAVFNAQMLAQSLRNVETAARRADFGSMPSLSSAASNVDGVADTLAHALRLIETHAPR